VAVEQKTHNSLAERLQRMHHTMYYLNFTPELSTTQLSNDSQWQPWQPGHQLNCHQWMWRCHRIIITCIIHQNTDIHMDIQNAILCTPPPSDILA